jgi:mersacidin/lichenicidin family type 2 lantibiotic
MKVDIVRAWKDPEYRKSLTPEQWASLPPHPADSQELTEEALSKITGGLSPIVAPRAGDCWTINFPCSI